MARARSIERRPSAKIVRVMCSNVRVFATVENFDSTLFGDRVDRVLKRSGFCDFWFSSGKPSAEIGWVECPNAGDFATF